MDTPIHVIENRVPKIGTSQIYPATDLIESFETPSHLITPLVSKLAALRVQQKRWHLHQFPVQPLKLDRLERFHGEA
jgi:hypothetical protein